MSRTKTSDARLRVGVDVGGTKVAVLVAKNGQELARAVNPTRLNSPDDTLTGIAETIQQAVSQAGGEMADVEAIGIGIPGRVDPWQGTVQLAVNLKLRDLAVGPMLVNRLRVPCFLENDVRMAALGLRFHPDFAHADNLAYLSIGTGIAAGILLMGELYRGMNGMAGEIGHIEVIQNGPRCVCGAAGCLEAVAAGPAIESQMAEVLARPSGKLVSVPHLSTGKIFQMAADGDPCASELVAQVGQHLGWAVKLLVLSYDIEWVVFGGGVSRATAFLDTILRNIAHRRQESDLAREMLKPEMIQLLPPNFDAPLWGGIALAEKGLVREEK